MNNSLENLYKEIREYAENRRKKSAIINDTNAKYSSVWESEGQKVCDITINEPTKNGIMLQFISKNLPNDIMAKTEKATNKDKHRDRRFYVKTQKDMETAKEIITSALR